MSKYFSIVLFLAGLALLSAGCNKDNEEPNTLKVNFIFSHSVGDQDVSFDEMIYTNAAGNTYSIETLKYFVSDLTLHQVDGAKVIFDMAHYVDARESSTLSFSAVNVPRASYDKLTFVFGLNEEQNTAGRFPNPPESNMEWPPAMGSGYHYMKLEGKFDSAGVIKNYQAHTGPSMGNHYYIEVVLSQDPVSCTCAEVDVSINMDINKWWENPNTLDLNDMSMVMGNQEVQQQLKENGANVFSLQILD